MQYILSISISNILYLDSMNLKTNRIIHKNGVSKVMILFQADSVCFVKAWSRL